jgi:SAM-dependent methyltransferase
MTKINLFNDILATDLAKQKINFYVVKNLSTDSENQNQTNDMFSEKWQKAQNQIKTFEAFQKRWYLDLYGFSSESDLAQFLRTKKVILDAGCGLGYKAAWFAELAPESLVIGMDYSEAASIASEIYSGIGNLIFLQGDISRTPFKTKSIDYVSCDQVIHHTEVPFETFQHLSSLLTEEGEFSCYVYAKKALPRELLDDHFREFSKELTKEQLWELSTQLTELGKNLSEINVKFQCPAIPLLGIQGGEKDIQRFIYWNFLKCFWNPEMGQETSEATNFDWYAPSNAERYSEEEYRAWVSHQKLEIKHWHKEEACYSGRFKKSKG